MTSVSEAMAHSNELLLEAVELEKAQAKKEGRVEMLLEICKLSKGDLMRLIDGDDDDVLL